MRKINTGLDNKRVSLNIIFSFIAFIVNMFISFFITPYITSTLGGAAYGFVNLANNFASYGSLLSLALNSMSSRFIMLEREKGNEEEARRYYSSITIANFVLAASLVLPCIILVIFIKSILNVPDDLLREVQLTFGWTLLNFLICLACTTFGNCFFLTNHLNISSFFTSITSIVKVAFIIGMFFIFGPHISFIGLSTLVVSAIFIPANIYYHKKLTPNLYFDFKLFEYKKVKQVLMAGVWNSINQLSNILTTGLDLLVTNVLVGALEMGYLSIAKTVPNFVFSLLNTIGNSFTPNFMQLYSRGQTNELKKAIKFSMRIMCIFSSIPQAFILSCGYAFFKLWVPEQPTTILNVLSILSVFSSCFYGAMQPLYQVFMVTNKIKNSSIVFIVEGFASFLITLCCVKFLGYGVYAVAGVSVTLSLLTMFAYHVPMSAKYAGLPWNSFYPEMGKVAFSTVIQTLFGLGLSRVLPITQSWLYLIIAAFLLGVFGLIINICLMLEKEERASIMKKILKKIKR